MPASPMPNKKSVIISGASSGIGAAIAVYFSNQGYDALLLGRSRERLEKTKSLCNPEVNVSVLDFELEKVDQNFERINEELSKLSPLHCLVNNAGVFQYKKIDSPGIDEWISQFEVNLFSAVKLTKFVWPKLINCKNGSIVNVASTLGIKPTAETSAYSASKAALINYSIALAQSGGKFGIRANCICPGIVDTPIHKFQSLDEEKSAALKTELASLQLLNRIGSPDEIAKAVYFLGSDLSSWTTGSVLSVDGGINIKND